MAAAVAAVDAAEVAVAVVVVVVADVVVAAADYDVVAAADAAGGGDGAVAQFAAAAPRLSACPYQRPVSHPLSRRPPLHTLQKPSGKQSSVEEGSPCCWCA